MLLSQISMPFRQLHSLSKSNVVRCVVNHGDWRKDACRGFMGRLENLGESRCGLLQISVVLNPGKLKEISRFNSTPEARFEASQKRLSERPIKIPAGKRIKSQIALNKRDNPYALTGKSSQKLCTRNVKENFS